MFTLEAIRELVSQGRYELTAHAVHRIVERNISAIEIRQTGPNLELLENYPTDKYGPSCLLLGWTTQKRPLHLHVSRKKNFKVKIITLYEPKFDEWDNFRTRRSIL